MLLDKFKMQGQVLEVADTWVRNELSTLTAADIPYNASNVGAELDNINNELSSLDASDVSYNSSNVKSELDDINADIDTINGNLSITSVTTPTTTNGTNATLYKSGNVITCKIETSNTQELGTQSMFATIGIIPSEHPEFIPNYSIIRYIQISNNLHGILRIGTDGVIGLGYTVDESGNSAPIPVNTNIYDITTFVSN